VEKKIAKIVGTTRIELLRLICKMILEELPTTFQGSLAVRSTKSCGEDSAAFLAELGSMDNRGAAAGENRNQLRAEQNPTSLERRRSVWTGKAPLLEVVVRAHGPSNRRTPTATSACVTRQTPPGGFPGQIRDSIHLARPPPSSKPACLPELQICRHSSSGELAMHTRANLSAVTCTMEMICTPNTISLHRAHFTALKSSTSQSSMLE